MDENHMTKRELKTKKDYMRIKSFTYFIRTALAEVQKMPPHLKEMLGQVIGDCNLTQLKDLETLEQALRKMTLS
jgi:hypothetical protein